MNNNEGYDTRFTGFCKEIFQHKSEHFYYGFAWLFGNGHASAGQMRRTGLPSGGSIILWQDLYLPDVFPMGKELVHIAAFQRDAALRPVGGNAPLVDVYFPAQRTAPRGTQPGRQTFQNHLMGGKIDTALLQSQIRILTVGIAEPQTAPVLALLLDQTDGVYALRGAPIPFLPLAPMGTAPQRHPAAQQNVIALKKG